MTTKVSDTNVTPLRLDSTRSYALIMYSSGVTLSMSMTKVSPKANQNALRHCCKILRTGACEAARPCFGVLRASSMCVAFG